MSSVAGQNGSAHLADINITPLIDVMLTVLVIFMITAPVVTRVIPVPLHGAAGQPTEAQVLAVGIADDGALSVNQRTATLTEMEVLVDAATSKNAAVRIDLRPTAGSTYTDLVDVLALASRHGVTNVRIEGVAGDD